MKKASRKKFTPRQIKVVNNAVAMAEELVSNFYKMSANQWLSRRYDIKTLADLKPEEVMDGPFAQIIRYQGYREDSSLGSSSYDFYKICLQDHTIQSALADSPGMKLFPFGLYIVIHELIHIVRFSKFLQNFEASPEERMQEEKRVHARTHEILDNIRITGLSTVLKYYNMWRMPYEGLQNP